jgi:DNA-binding NtrC family response regulator
VTKAVLVLDDDVDVAELMRVVLEDANFRVFVANRPSDIPSERFDCIVTDLEGVEVYTYDDARDWLLRLADRFPRTPVVLATAHVQAREDADRLGARVLAKPFDVEDLVAVVREAMTR